MFHRKPPPIQHTDLIDLLLHADEPTRKLLLLQALQTGTLGKSEAEEVVAMVGRLERAAAPRSEETAQKATAQEPSAQEPAAPQPARAA